MHRLIVYALLLSIVPAVRAAEPPVATVGGRAITRSDVETHVRAKLIELDNQRYEVMREGIDDLIAEEVLKQEAKARGVTVEQLEEVEVVKKVPEPSAEEVKEIYEENKEALDNAPFEMAQPYIVELLKQQAASERRNELVRQLRNKYKVSIALKPPVVEVGTGGRPSRGGGAKAAVTIISFSDYECPFCKRAESTVDQVLAHYGEKIRFVHRDFPLSFHQHARQAAEAAHCAEAQGKFWEYHAKLFKSEDLSTEKLKALAGEVGLDQKKFDECLSTQQFKDAVERDFADGTSAGVTGTPAFFINGRLLSGAQPFDKFKEIIDEELAAAEPPKS